MLENNVNRFVALTRHACVFIPCGRHRIKLKRDKLCIAIQIIIITGSTRTTLRRLTISSISKVEAKKKAAMPKLSKARTSERKKCRSLEEKGLNNNNDHWLLNDYWMTTIIIYVSLPLLSVHVNEGHSNYTTYCIDTHIYTTWACTHNRVQFIKRSQISNKLSHSLQCDHPQ